MSRWTRVATVIVCALFGTSACSTGGGYLAPVPPSGGEMLGEDSGYVLVQVDTEIPLDWITISGARIAANLPEGESTWLVPLRAGTYDWKSIRPGAASGLKETIRLADYHRLRRLEDWVWHDEFTFDVEAGAVNYPGTLIVQVDPIHRRPWVRVRNRSAMAVKAAGRSYEALLSRYRLRHAGAGDDRFLEFYSELRDRAADGRARPEDRAR